jgi:hypothetical protein
MRAKLNSGGGCRASGAQPAVLELRLSSELGRAVPVLPLEMSDAIIGTVHSTMQPVSAGFYVERSEALIRGVPLASTALPIAPRRTRTQLCAADLIAELQTINTQIHRMMFQVERAVANLAIAG